VIAMGNLIDAKHQFTSIPLKIVYQISSGVEDRENMSSMTQVAEILMWTYAGTFTVTINAWPAIKLIDMGMRPLPIFERVTFVRNNPWVKPIFHYYHGSSDAYRFGARYGGRVGGKIASRLIPLAGWALVAYDVYDLIINRSIWGFDIDDPGSISWG